MVHTYTRIERHLVTMLFCFWRAFDIDAFVYVTLYLTCSPFWLLFLTPCLGHIQIICSLSALLLLSILCGFLPLLSSLFLVTWLGQMLSVCLAVCVFVCVSFGIWTTTQFWDFTLLKWCVCGRCICMCVFVTTKYSEERQWSTLIATKREKRHHLKIA